MAIILPRLGSSTAVKTGTATGRPTPAGATPTSFKYEADNAPSPDPTLPPAQTPYRNAQGESLEEELARQMRDTVAAGKAASSPTPAAADPWAGIDPRLSALYKKYGVNTPGASGSGFTDASYWGGEAVQHAGGDWNYILNRLEGNLAGHGVDAPGPGDRGYGSQSANVGSNANVFDDPATKEWEQLLRQLVDRFNTPQQTWSPAQLELQQTQVLDPMERQRQQQKQQAQVQLASRGIVPGSGIYDQAMQDVDRQFNQLRTTAQSGFATQAINREDRVFQNNENRASNAVNLFKQIPQMADTRLASAQGSLQNPQQLIQLLMSQQNTDQSNARYSQTQNQNFLYQLIAQLLPYFS